MARADLERVLRNLDVAAARVDDRSAPVSADEPDVPNWPYRFGWLRAELNDTRRVLRAHLAEPPQPDDTEITGEWADDLDG
jgi:hypothetical protein